MSFIDEVYATDLQKEMQDKVRVQMERWARREAREYTELIKSHIHAAHSFQNMRHLEVYLSSIYDSLKLDDKGKCFKKNRGELLGYYLSQELETLGLKDFRVVFEEIPEFEEKGIIFKRKIKNYNYGTKIYIILDW